MTQLSNKSGEAALERRAAVSGPVSLRLPSTGRALRGELIEVMNLALPAYLVSRAVLFLAAWAAIAAMGSQRVLRFGDPAHPAPMQAWLSWDAVHYLRIAAGGYPASASASDAGYFPLLPALLRLTAGDPVAATVMGFFLGLAGLAVVVGLTRRVLGPEAARRTAWIACWWPAAFVLSAVYTEALFLLTVAGALWAAWRGRVLTAAVLGAGAALVRPTGFLVALPLLLLLPAGRARLAAVAPLAATAAFCAFLWLRTGTPLAFAVSQTSNHAVHPGTLSLLSVRSLNPDDLLGLACAILSAVLAFRLWRMPELGRWRLISLLLVAVLLLPSLTTGTMSSFGRYAFAAFPLFWAASALRLARLAPFAVAASVAVTVAFASGRAVP